jgi:hypothetical protein
VVLKKDRGDSWTNRWRNEVLCSQQGKNFLPNIKSMKDGLTGQIPHRRCLLKHVIKGKIEGRIDMWRR